MEEILGSTLESIWYHDDINDHNYISDSDENDVNMNQYVNCSVNNISKTIPLPIPIPPLQINNEVIVDNCIQILEDCKIKNSIGLISIDEKISIDINKINDEIKMNLDKEIKNRINLNREIKNNKNKNIIPKRRWSATSAYTTTSETSSIDRTSFDLSKEIEIHDIYDNYDSDNYLSNQEDDENNIPFFLQNNEIIGNSTSTNNSSKIRDSSLLLDYYIKSNIIPICTDHDDVDDSSGYNYYNQATFLEPSLDDDIDQFDMDP